MTITIEFFGVLERLAGHSSLPIEVRGDSVTVSDALDELARRVPEIAPELERTACAIGDDIVLRDHEIASGTRLALLPPVAGG